MKDEHNHWAGLVDGDRPAMPEPASKQKAKRRQLVNRKIISLHVTLEQWDAIHRITGGPGKSAWIREAIDQRLEGI